MPARLYLDRLIKSSGLRLTAADLRAYEQGLRPAPVFLSLAAYQLNGELNLGRR